MLSALVLLLRLLLLLKGVPVPKKGTSLAVRDVLPGFGCRGTGGRPQWALTAVLAPVGHGCARPSVCPLLLPAPRGIVVEAADAGLGPGLAPLLVQLHAPIPLGPVEGFRVPLTLVLRGPPGGGARVWPVISHPCPFLRLLSRVVPPRIIVGGVPLCRVSLVCRAPGCIRCLLRLSPVSGQGRQVGVVTTRVGFPFMGASLFLLRLAKDLSHPGRVRILGGVRTRAQGGVSRPHPCDRQDVPGAANGGRGVASLPA